MIMVKTISSEETHPLRLEILRKGSPDKTVVFNADDQPDTFHLGAFVDDKLVGIATYQREECPEHSISAIIRHKLDISYRLRGMAVSEEYERQGIGTLILAVGEDRLLQRGIKLLWCHARIKAISFYEKTGWTVYGERFFIESVGDHEWMAKLIEPHICACHEKNA